MRQQGGRPAHNNPGVGRRENVPRRNFTILAISNFYLVYVTALNSTAMAEQPRGFKGLFGFGGNTSGSKASALVMKTSRPLTRELCTETSTPALKLILCSTIAMLVKDSPSAAISLFQTFKGSFTIDPQINNLFNNVGSMKLSIKVPHFSRCATGGNGLDSTEIPSLDESIPSKQADTLKGKQDWDGTSLFATLDLLTSNVAWPTSSDRLWQASTKNPAVLSHSDANMNETVTKTLVYNIFTECRSTLLSHQK
jgi:hypothetical protein